ncbi:MAG TPA: response regulator transcription factor [Gammaproteobacteria bacterium]|jgi:DNA-binding response OmpR family regulator|nr:response regulator transcription factor [Gammaproteobacteria bacterium]
MSSLTQADPEKQKVDLRISSTPTRAPFKALIATDDAALTTVEHSALKQLHFDAVTVHDDGEMLHSIHAERPDLVILDADLPGGGGLEACRRLREDPSTASIPIIMVTGEDDSSERIEALETGADDCVTKPLQVEMLVAHIKALARRALQAVTPGHRLRAGPIDMDLDRWTVQVSGAPIELTKKEFRLLQVLLEAKGRALTRDFLLQEAWSHGTIHGLDTRTVDVHIGRLRRKLGKAGHYIITVRNVGFRFDILPEWFTPRS